MAKRAAPDVFKRGETVKTLDPLPGVPQGEKGRVYLVDGLVWTRYRVLFDNGVDIGLVPHGTTLLQPNSGGNRERRVHQRCAPQAQMQRTPVTKCGAGVSRGQTRQVAGGFA